MAKNKKTERNEDQEEVNVHSLENEESTSEDQSNAKEKLAGENTPEEEISSEQAEIERLKIELSEAKDKYLRLYSEFDNYRRRTAKERLDLVQSANQELLKDLLPVVDDFERASQNYSDDVDPVAFKEGVDLISNKFVKILNQKGVKQMEAKEGSEFDPEIHEAITQIPAPKEELKGKVVDVIEKGYYLHDKVIRFARVVIGS